MLHLVSVQASVITRCLLPRIETGYYRATFPRWCLAVPAHSYRTWSSSGWGFRWTLVCQQLFCAPTAPLCLWSKSAGCLFAGQNGVSYICYGIHTGAASHTNKKETSGESWGSMLLLVKFKPPSVALTVRQRQPAESHMENNRSCRAKRGLAVSALRPVKEK